nr:polyamine aminopropyltransferase [Bacillus solimangrovi]
MTRAAERNTRAIYWASGIVSICGIIFEVLFGALGSYILGDGVKQYTLTISLFLTGMGIGASISEKVMKKLILAFVLIEFSVALIGGFSSFLLFSITAYLAPGTDAFFLYLVTLLIGGLTGLELPILIRKANEIGVELNRSTARVLFSDYAGGLIGGLLFVFLLRPKFGLVKTAFLVAIINAVVAVWVLWLFQKEIQQFKRYFIVGIAIIILLFAGLMFGEKIAFTFEQKLYRDPIIHSEETAYQHIIVTKRNDDVRLFLNGSLQFSSTDEYRYHEMIVHPPMTLASDRENILILGGGDGLATRELLKYEDVKQITMVDLDPRVVELAKTHPDIVKLNEGVFEDKRLNVIHQDAFQFMEQSDEWFDVILVDLPDPNNESLNKLYTVEFYSLLRNHLKPGGKIMIQSTSPVFATKVYWTIDRTVKETGLYTENFHVDIPSFGNWGFIMASREEIDLNKFQLEVETKFLTEEMLLALTYFGKDEDGTFYDSKGRQIELQPNTLIRPNLIEKYSESWSHY